MKKIDEKLILEEINRIKTLFGKSRFSNVIDVSFEEKNVVLEKTIDRNKILMNYNRKNSFLFESTETNKIHKMGNLLYPDESYSVSTEGERLSTMGVLGGQNNSTDSDEGKKFKNYALRIATEKEWMSIFPYSMSKFFDPSFKRYPELYKKWNGKTAKQAEDSMLVKVWDTNVTFKDFNTIDFTKTTDLSTLPGFTPADDEKRSLDYYKSKEEWDTFLETGKYKSIWENPEFVRNWSGKDDNLFNSLFLGPLFYVELSKRAISKGYEYTPDWFKNWWENTAGPWIADYGWIPSVILGVGAVVAAILGAPVLAFGLGIATIAIDVLEISYYAQKNDPFMAGLCAIFLLLPGDAILRVIGGKKYMRKAANWLAEWCLGPGAKESTQKTLKEGGEELFGPIIQIGTNTKLLFMATRKMFRAKLVSLLTKLRIKGLCKVIVWLISKGWLLAKFLLKIVFTMGTVAVTWIMLCKHFGIKLPWEGGSQETQVLNDKDTGKFVALVLKDLVNDNKTIKKSEVGEYKDIRVTVIQLALRELGYDNILESDTSTLSYADKNYGYPKDEKEAEMRCKTMFSLGDVQGLSSDPRCKKYQSFYNPLDKSTAIKLTPNYDLGTKNTIKNIEDTKKDALSKTGLGDFSNKKMGLSFNVQDKNITTGLSNKKYNSSVSNLNLGLTPGTISPTWGIWDSAFDKMIWVFQKRNNLKQEEDITIEFLTILEKQFKPISASRTINYDAKQLRKEYENYYMEGGSAQKQASFIMADQLQDLIDENENDTDLRQDLYDTTIDGADNFNDVDDATQALSELDSIDFQMNKNDSLIKPILIDWDTEDIDNY